MRYLARVLVLLAASGVMALGSATSVTAIWSYANPTHPSPPLASPKVPDAPRKPAEDDLAAWNEPGRIDDPRLRAALELIAAAVPELDAVLRYDAAEGVRILTAEPNDPGAAGDYNDATKVIRLGPRYVAGNQAELAAMLAHELVHAAQSPSMNTCAREIDAYSREAEAWERIESYSSSASAWLDELARSWRTGELPHLVPTWPLYRSVCEGYQP